MICYVMCICYSFFKVFYGLRVYIMRAYKAQNVVLSQSTETSLIQSTNMLNFLDTPGLRDY